MEKIDLFDTKNYTIGYILSVGENATGFMVSFFHTNKSAIKCTVRFEKSTAYEGTYHSTYTIRTLNSCASISAGAEKEFVRRSIQTIKNLYRSKFLCGGEQHGKTDNQKISRETSV